METILNLFHQGYSSIVPFVVLLGVLIFVHELGHFSVAKFFGVRVETFSLGFGRKFLQKKVGDTTYALSIIPFGGYVKMYGDDLTAEIPKEQQKYSFSHKHVLPRIAIVLAGPMMNAFFAILLFTVIAGVGEEVLKAKVGDVYPNTEAYKVGFRTDDVVKSVNGQSIDRWDNLKKTIEESQGRNLDITVSRAAKGQAAQDVVLHSTPVIIANKNVLSDQSQIGDIEGLNYLSRASAVGVKNSTTTAAVAGIKTGDIIRKVDGQEITRWDELVSKLTGAAAQGKASVAFEIERNNVPNVNVTFNVAAQDPMGGLEPSDLYLSNVLPKSAAEGAGVLPGDRLVAINGDTLTRWEDVIKVVQGYNPAGGPLHVAYLRNGQKHEADIVPKLLKQTDNTGGEVSNYALGIVTGLVFANPDTLIYKEHNPVTMLDRGFSEFGHWVKLTALSFVRLAQGRVSSKSIGGPLMIGKLASDTWRIGISPFLKIMAIISINLFLLNLLPIPVLDGGHLLFYVIELVKGTPLSFRKIEVMQQVGMFLLLALMVFSMFNDIVRFFTS